MSLKKIAHMGLSERDLDFLVEAEAPGVGDKSNLKRIIREDDDFCNSFISDQKVFRRLMDDDQMNFIAEYYLRTRRHSLCS
jgi:hypothetical protein